jgi:thioredoxin reductase (NADPH)
MTRELDTQRDEYQLIIIGSGPAGLTAGIYTARSKVDTLIIEGQEPGGLLTTTPSVENWPGYKKIGGKELMKKIYDHADHAGCYFLKDSVKAVDFSEKPYKVTTYAGKTYKAHSIIIAMGVERKKLGCPGEQEYWGFGVSACATCDASFCEDKTVVVVGGGNSALIEANHLSHFAKKVYVVHRSEKIKTFDPIKYVVMQNPKIEIIHNSHVKQIKGEGSGDDRYVTGIEIENKKEEKVSTIPTDSVFVAIGFLPSTKIFEGQIELDKNKYIKKSKDSMSTSAEGVFWAGDIGNRKYQQAIVAAGDGCKAALDCITYLDVTLRLSLNR